MRHHEPADGLPAAGDLNQDEATRWASYRMFQSGDGRFDGQLYVGVASTGVYCRPVCTARMPKFENCTFYRTAAEAETAGFRPCLLCRPEMAPGLSAVDAKPGLARRAAQMMREDCSSPAGVERVASRLGCTARHLRRAFAEEYGMGPAQYLRTCRLLLAKSLLTDSSLPVAQVAAAAGFGSVRRFNQVFKERYRMTPSALRKGKRRPGGAAGVVRLRIGYRPPFGFGRLLGFFGARALAGVEVVGEDFYQRTVRLQGPGGEPACGWVRVEDEPGRNRLVVTMSDALVPHVSEVVGRVRRMFDTDCAPGPVADGLAVAQEALPGCEVLGTRLPGCFDPFEIACRAVLGQQVTVSAANALAARVAEAYGPEVDTGVDGLERAWPAPEDILALDPVEDALGKLGVIRTRSRVIAELARLVASGRLDLEPGADAEEQMERLLAIKGVGPWTAGYIAMRTLGHPDAFLETDAGVAHALPGLSPKERLVFAEGCRPWRSYLVVALWNSLG